MKYQVPKEHYFRMYNKVFDLDLKATTFLVYSYFPTPVEEYQDFCEGIFIRDLC